MPVNCEIILFSRSLEQVARQPDLVACVGRTLGEDLELPLTCSDFGIDTLNVEACFKAQVEMLFNQFTTVSVTCTH